jgi:two-component system, sensor histidine kinase and response regulator
MFLTILLLSSFTVILVVVIYSIRLKRKLDIVRAERLKVELERDNMAEKSFRQSKLLALLTHHIMGPLNYNHKMIELMVERPDKINPEEGQVHLNLIAQSLGEMQYTLSQLMDWAKAQHGDKRGSIEDHPLIDLFENELEFIRPQANWKALEISIECNPSWVIKTDSMVFHLVFQNLLSNAIKFSKKGSKLQLLALLDESYLKVGVKDEAGGVEPEIAKKIFSKSNHLPAKGTENEIGSGMGLLLAQDLAESHGLAIELETDSNGSFFYLRVKLEDE